MLRSRAFLPAERPEEPVRSRAAELLYWSGSRRPLRQGRRQGGIRLGRGRLRSGGRRTVRRVIDIRALLFDDRLGQGGAAQLDANPDVSRRPRLSLDGESYRLLCLKSIEGRVTYPVTGNDRFNWTIRRADLQLLGKQRRHLYPVAGQGARVGDVNPVSHLAANGRGVTGFDYVEPVGGNAADLKGGLGLLL